MPTTDPIKILLAHDRWATHNLLSTCRGLTQAQFNQRFEMGCGSLHDNLLHMLSAMRAWGDLLAGRETRPPLEGEHSPDQMAQLLEEIAGDMQQSAERPPAEQVTGSRGGRTFTFTRAGVLVHVTTHGMHHRAQCLNMLRQLGVEPLPHSSVLDWILMVDSQA